jgi:hypothetical protein
VIDGTKAAARWRREVAIRTVIAFDDGFMITCTTCTRYDYDRIKMSCVCYWSGDLYGIFKTSMEMCDPKDIS